MTSQANSFCGWTGKAFFLDLSTKRYFHQDIPEDVLAGFIGGRGLAGYFLRDQIILPWDHPEMPLILATGPLVGTHSPTSGRMTLMSRSPLTGTIGDSSVGGSLGAQLKKAGYDCLVITGKSRKLCGIELSDSVVEIVDCQNMSGKTTGEIFSLLKNKGSSAVIGPAAENLVLYASVMVDGSHAAGRTGLGAVMAAKNLKYITIKGSGEIRIHDNDRLLSAREDIYRQIAASPVLMGEHGITNYGTGALYDLMSSRRMMPTDNFQKTYFQNSLQMNAHAYKKKYEIRKTGCPGCHILCKKVAKSGDVLPEFETMSHFSALIGNTDLASVVRANQICKEMGMDTISLGATISCFQEITGQKLSTDNFLKLVEDIGLGRGLGKALAQGSFRYARLQGRSYLSMSVKGMELPAYDPRGAFGMALAYAFSTRGGCHLRAYPISHEILRKPVATDRFTFSGKARIIKIAEDVNAVVDSLTACKFLFFATSLEEYAKVFTAVTGLNSSAQDLLKIGERIYYLERMMNSANGFKDIDDDLPPRFFEEEGSSGNNLKVPPLNRVDFLRARQDYYRIRGLTHDGLPKKRRAVELGLPWND